jgi:hypothetical protein
VYRGTCQRARSLTRPACVRVRAHASGRLPVTMPNINNEERMTVEQYPGVDNAENSTYTYAAAAACPRLPARAMTCGATAR